MKTINEYAYESRIKNVHPNIKLLNGIIPLIAVLVFNSFFVSIFVFLLVGAVTVINSKITMLKYCKLMLIPGGFLLLSVITIIFGIGEYNNPIFDLHIGGMTLYCTTESIENGISLLVKSMSAVGCMYFITLNTTMNDIIYALKKIRVPTMIISLTELMYRYIFVLIEEYTKIHVAQRSRLGYRNFKTSVKASGQLIASLFIKTYNKCDRVYNALKSRGYTGEIAMLDKEYEKSVKSYIVTCIFPIIISVVFLLEKRWFG